MTLTWLLTAWCVCVVAGTVLAAVLPRTRWWVGLLACAILGPVGLALIVLDVATYKRGTVSP